MWLVRLFQIIISSIATVHQLPFQFSPLSSTTHNANSCHNSINKTGHNIHATERIILKPAVIPDILQVATPLSWLASPSGLWGFRRWRWPARAWRATRAAPGATAEAVEGAVSTWMMIRRRWGRQTTPPEMDLGLTFGIMTGCCWIQ